MKIKDTIVEGRSDEKLNMDSIIWGLMREGDISKLRSLKEGNSKYFEHVFKEEKASVLTHATYLGNIELVKFFAEECDLLKTELEKDPIYNPLQIAIHQDYPEIIEYLLSQEPNLLNRKISEESIYPINLAIGKGSIKSFKILLKSKALALGIEDTIFEDEQETKLNTAIEASKLEEIKKFLDMKDRFNDQSNMLNAIKYDNKYVFSFLLNCSDSSFDINQKYTGTNYASSYADGSTKNTAKTSLLENAILLGRVDIALELLNCPDDLDIKVAKALSFLAVSTNEHFSKKVESKQMILKIIDKIPKYIPSDPSTLTPNSLLEGGHPIHIIAKTDNSFLLEKALEYPLKFPLNIEASNYQTPLFLAMANNKDDNAKMLINAGAEVTDAVIEACINQGNVEMFRFLAERDPGFFQKELSRTMQGGEKTKCSILETAKSIKNSKEKKRGFYHIIFDKIQEIIDIAELGHLSSTESTLTIVTGLSDVHFIDSNEDTPSTRPSSPSSSTSKEEKSIG